MSAKPRTTDAPAAPAADPAAQPGDVMIAGAPAVPASPEVQDQEAKAEEFAWDELLPAEDAPTKTYQAGKSVDVFKDIPAPIRQRIEEALSAHVTYSKEADTRGTKPENRVPQWKRQPVASEAQAKKFADFAKKYAKFRPNPTTPEPAVASDNVPAPTIEFQVPGTPDGQITVRAVPVSATDPETKAVTWAVRYQARNLQNRETRTLPGSGTPAPGAALTTEPAAG